MKVRSQILLLLLVSIAVFLAGISLIKREEEKRVRELTDEYAMDLNHAFDRFIGDRQRPLELFVSASFNGWDDLVRAAQNKDAARMPALLSEDALHSYDANAAWVLGPDFSLLAANNDIPARALNAPEFVATLHPETARNAPQGCHYFVWSPEGLLEVRGIALRPSWLAREEVNAAPPAGYFFAARLWTNRDAEELGAVTDNEVKLVSMQDGPQARQPGPQPEVITFQRELKGPDGQPVAWLRVRHLSRIISAFETAVDELALWLILFSVVLLLILAAALHSLVSIPLQVITRSLHTRALGPLVRLRKRHSEIGELAGLIADFHAQRDQLLAQMDERRAAEHALEESKEQLRQAQKMEAIGRLAGGIAHDFNNLLTAIIGYAGLLSEELAGNPEASRRAATIRQAGEQAAGLTRQLLAFSRKQLLQPQVLDLNTLVADAERLLHRIIGEHVEIQTELGAMPGWIKADYHQVEQVVLNLAVNARDAMPRGGKLLLKTGNKLAMENEIPELPPGEYVMLQVTDTGQGMNAETLERIFEPFFTTKVAGKGTGLGLATVYGVVKQSGGGIHVESIPGRGTSFRVYFPKTTETPARAAAPAHPLDAAAGGETILVVDDERMIGSLVSDVLKPQRYRMLVASGPEEAIGLSRQHRIDLLITDVVMPRIDGRALAEILEARHRGLKILFVSGYAESSGSGPDLPVDAAVLAKPFTPDSLSRKVRELLGAAD